MKHITIVVLSGFLMACAAAAPKRPQPPLLSAADLAKDVDILEATYDALHPGLYRYNTPAQIRQHVSDLRRALDHDQSLASAYLAFSQFAATIRCGHTYANFFNQTKATQAALFEGRNRVPFYFRWLDGHMVITHNFSANASLVPGTEILAIEGIPTREILSRLLTIARADGSNDAKRIAILEVQGLEKIETFDVFLPLFFPQVGAHQTLVVRVPGARRERRVIVDAFTYAQRLGTRPLSRAGDEPAWTLGTADSRLAVLRMPTWALYDKRWDWKAYLQTAFETLAERDTPALVIDLRGNEGGLDVGDELLAHLIDSDLHVSGYLRLVRYRKVPDALSPYLSTWDPSFRDWGDKGMPFNERYFRLKRYDDNAGGTVIHPKAPRYGGKVFVLIGATNSSATFEFAREAQRARLGILVGQPTGGNQRGINGGAFFFLNLPNSGIELDVPLIGQFPSTGDAQLDAGLTPDIQVPLTRDAMASGKDMELDFVISALAKPP